MNGFTDGLKVGLRMFMNIMMMIPLIPWCGSNFAESFSKLWVFFLTKDVVGSKQLLGPVSSVELYYVLVCFSTENSYTSVV